MWFDSELLMDVDFVVEEYGCIVLLYGDFEFVNMLCFFIDGSLFYVYMMCLGKVIIVEYLEM